MTTTYNFYLPDFTSEIIYWNTFPKFLSFVYMTYKLSILSNHVKHPKELAPCYMLSLFIILKSLYLISQPACLKKMTSVREKLVKTLKLSSTSRLLLSTLRLFALVFALMNSGLINNACQKLAIWALWETSYLEYFQSIVLEFWYWYSLRGSGQTCWSRKWLNQEPS